MSLSTNYTFFGRGNWSLDAVGGTATGGGTISAIVPEGSTIQRAFLYSSTFGIGATPGSVTLTLGASATTVDDDDYVALGTTNGGSAGLIQAFRTDITSFAVSAIGNGDDDAFDIIASDVTGGRTDGFVLVLVYANAAEQERTISLLDGVSDTDGDDFSLSFDEPIDPGPDYSALFSLGIGFSFQGSGQFSNVSVNGRPLTGAAGGSDDGQSADGGLITVGGIGDSPDNPDNPTVGPSDSFTDDELYDLAQGNALDGTPFLPAGTSTITVSTINPSDNDNIFFAGFNITDFVLVDGGDNDAPIAVADSGAGFTTDEDTAFTTANVLGNDADPEDDTLTITDVDTTGLVGTLTDNGDGTFDYDPDGQFEGLGEGEEATTSFSYTISDGDKTASTTVTITITGVDDGVDPTPECPVVTRDGTVDGSPAADQSLTGGVGANTFYFSVPASSGDDTITNFEAVDVLVADALLLDRNGDGFVGFGTDEILDLDASDSVTLPGVDPTVGLRYLGESCEGVYVYAEGTVRPEGAIEGLVDDSALSGAAGTDVFFFDPALEIDLGDDTITGFGVEDFLVTTTALDDSNGDGIIGFGADDMLDLPGGVGSVTINGMAVTRLELDGSVVRDGVEYFYYSRVGSTTSFDSGSVDI